MASFKRAKYQTDYGPIYAIRVDTSTITDDNPEPTGAFTDGLMYVGVNKTKRSQGLTARKVRLSRVIGQVAGRDVKAHTTRPLLKPTTPAEIDIGQVLTFDGVDWIVDGFISEG